MRQPVVFPSFTHGLNAVCSGGVRARDLERGLFAFSCSHDYVVSPDLWGAVLQQLRKTHPVRVADFLAQLIPATTDEPPRVRWRDPAVSCTLRDRNPKLKSALRAEHLGRLNQLFGDHGLPVVVIPEPRLFTPTVLLERLPYSVKVVF